MTLKKDLERTILKLESEIQKLRNENREIIKLKENNSKLEKQIQEKKETILKVETLCNGIKSLHFDDSIDRYDSVTGHAIYKEIKNEVKICNAIKQCLYEKQDSNQLNRYGF